MSYTDAEFAGDAVEWKSISAGMQFVKGIVAGWHCCKQTSEALSIPEADFVSAATGGVEILGIKELIMEIGMQVKTSIVQRIDFIAAIERLNNETSSANGKHVDIKLQFSRDYMAKGKMRTDYAETKAMVAELLTKSRAASRINELNEAIGLSLKH